MPKDKKIILGLVGEMACGKGFASRYLEEKYHASIYKFSSLLREMLSILDMKVSRENLAAISLILRERFGQNIIGKGIAKKAKNDNNPIIVLDGIRRMEDVKPLEKLKNFMLVKVVADPRVRYERFIKRNENVGDNKKTYEKFIYDQKSIETEIYIPEIMRKAKESLDNNDGAEKLYKQIDKLIKKYG
ncbi:AAA family ATPase [Candidatus Falkowbacteria bacterium]|nr:AAA family ATPase [Candidatus Falkowbacteria bacterium]